MVRKESTRTVKMEKKNYSKNISGNLEKKKGRKEKYKWKLRRKKGRKEKYKWKLGRKKPMGKLVCKKWQPLITMIVSLTSNPGYRFTTHSLFFHVPHSFS